MRNIQLPQDFRRLKFSVHTGDISISSASYKDKYVMIQNL